MAGGNISLPSDEENGGFVSNTRNWFNKRWNGNSGETIPLLGGDHQQNKKTTFRVIVTGVVLLIALAVLGLVAGLWYRHHEENKIIKANPEKFILETPSNSSIHDYLKHYTSVAHLAGTDNDKDQAEWTRDQFQSFGIDAKIETYYPLLNYPVSSRFGIVSGPKKHRYEAKLVEDIVDEDETSKDQNAVPLFHGYSKNGTATGRVVYANYGRLEDFQRLKDQGIKLEGTIALVRYGGSFRGLKVRAAEQFGVVGVLIYSDPIDDGPLGKDEHNGNPAESYPAGPWRSGSSAQRGSVSYLSLATGDPLTPGYAATKDAPRIKPEDSPGLAKIPSLPLSWEDALPILKATQGLGVKGGKEWTGGLEGVGYYSGPTEGEAILVNHIENKITPIWNVIGRIEGSEEPNRSIILGNHRDAWVFGAVDPSSGSASLLELARVFGELLKTGWRPKRTIILASWDAEEYGLVGSTEWVEDNKSWLDKEGTVYINVDVAVSGPDFSAGASPSLNRLIYEVASEVKDPRSGASVYDAWVKRTKVQGNTRPPVEQLGSGSDFVPFLDYAGIASLQLGFGGDYGVYHSNYDSFHWMEKFGDPQFLYHQTLVKIWGLLTLRLADSTILPIEPRDYATELVKYADSLAILPVTPILFPDLEQAIEELDIAAADFQRAKVSLEQTISKYDSEDDIPKELKELAESFNYRLTNFERGFLDPQGLEGREWFKHVVYAPGLWTGYSSQVFPGIADSIADVDLEKTRRAEKRAALSIKKAAEWLKSGHP